MKFYEVGDEVTCVLSDYYLRKPVPIGTNGVIVEVDKSTRFDLPYLVKFENIVFKDEPNRSVWVRNDQIALLRDSKEVKLQKLKDLLANLLQDAYDYGGGSYIHSDVEAGDFDYLGSDENVLYFANEIMKVLGEE